MTEARRHRALAWLEAEALLVTTLVNVRYLSGFTGSNAALLIKPDATPVLVTDGRYVDQAAAECPDCEVVVDRDLLGPIAARVAGATVAVETHTLSADDHARWVELHSGATASAGRVVERDREVKDSAEIDALRRACAISVEALTQIFSGPIVGRTEQQIARDLECRMFDLGAEALAFDTICAAGENSAIPHHHPTDRPVARGDLLKIDFGARVDGYHADCTRTAVVGPPADWQREIHAAVQQAQALGVQALVQEAAVADVDAAVRADLADTGWLERFTTGLGHGVGLQIHEDPFFGARHPGRLADRTVLTMEPGIYLPGRGGVRIEDTVCVTSGPPEVLTPTTTDLQEIG